MDIQNLRGYAPGMVFEIVTACLFAVGAWWIWFRKRADRSFDAALAAAPDYITREVIRHLLEEMNTEASVDAYCSRSLKELAHSTASEFVRENGHYFAVSHLVFECLLAACYESLSRVDELTTPEMVRVAIEQAAARDYIKSVLLYFPEEPEVIPDSCYVT